MANLTASLAQDNYKSTLSQAYNWAVGTMYVKNTPTVTFPAGKKVFLTINPEKSNMQVVRVSARDSTLKTITVDSIAVNKWSGSAYTQQSHAVGSKVVISIPYAVWEDLDTVTTGKNDTNSADTATGKFADTTARDAYFTAPVNGNTAYITSLWAWTDYIAGAWSTRATWSVVNADTTTAGKVEISTQAETEAKTATGWSWATLVPTNATINPNNITSATLATGDKISFSDVSASNVLRSTTIQSILNFITSMYRGDGSDWDVTINSGTTTLTRDMQYNNLTVTSPWVLNPAWYRIFVKGTLSWNGTISRNWNVGWAWWTGTNLVWGTAGAAATTLWQGSLNAEIASVAGWVWWFNATAWTVWASWTASALSLSNVTSVAGWAWGLWVDGAWWAAGATAASTRWSKYNTVINTLSLLFHSATAQGTQFENYKWKASSSGWWGWWGSVASWGNWGWWGWGSGGNGWLIRIAAFIYSFTGTISAVWWAWWAGWAWSATSAWAGGWWGWWGWNGGTILRMYNTIPNDWTKTLTWWAWWAWWAKTWTGVAGSAGTTGATGETISIVI